MTHGGARIMHVATRLGIAAAGAGLMATSAAAAATVNRGPGIQKDGRVTGAGAAVLGIPTAITAAGLGVGALGFFNRNWTMHSAGVATAVLGAAMMGGAVLGASISDPSEPGYEWDHDYDGPGNA